MKQEKIDETLKKHMERLRKKSNVLSFRTDQTKISEGKDTGKPCITVYVTKKVKRALLSNKDAVPKEIEGVLTDIVELSTEDWEIGQTTVGLKTPEEQRRLMGVIKKK